MDEPVRWLGEQLDEDERITRATDGTAFGLQLEWSAFSEDEAFSKVTNHKGHLVARQLGPADAAHIAAHNPARVLREIDAKRQLIARGGPFCTSNCDEPGNEPMNPDTNWTTPLEHHFGCAAYEAARVLAVPYAHRPGYREEWQL